MLYVGFFIYIIFFLEEYKEKKEFLFVFSYFDGKYKLLELYLKEGHRTRLLFDLLLCQLIQNNV